MDVQAITDQVGRGGVRPGAPQAVGEQRCQDRRALGGVNVGPGGCEPEGVASQAGRHIQDPARAMRGTHRADQRQTPGGIPSPQAVGKRSRPVDGHGAPTRAARRAQLELPGREGQQQVRRRGRAGLVVGRVPGRWGGRIAVPEGQPKPCGEGPGSLHQVRMVEVDRNDGWRPRTGLPTRRRAHVARIQADGP
jgi:hypothetical protein